MLLTINCFNISNKLLKRFLEHSLYLSVVFFLVPIIYYFELYVVLPAVEEKWTLPYFIHLICGHFILMNIVGNLVYGMFTCTSIKGRVLNYKENSGWTFCSACECFRPPRAWHCSICNICILKRDHHCTFLACCVGYHNQRYFVMLVFYIFIAMMYASYYNTYFLSSYISWNHGLVIFKFLLPLVSIVFDFGYESICIIILILNVVIGLFTGFLFVYHLSNIVKGRIVHERKLKAEDFAYDRGYKLNLIEVFGSNWHLTWISPFINSPLPGNGIEWIVNDKNK